MLLSKDVLSGICNELKMQNKKVVFTNGCFDILHTGHIRYLEESKKLGDVLVIGLNSDSSVKMLKGESRPVNNQYDRAEVLSALRCVDYICIFEEETPYKLIATLLPDILTKGGDYNPDNIAGADIVRNNGGDVVIINFVEGKSTSLIIDKMKNK